MLNTDFEQLFDKVLNVLATTLVKDQLIIEDKLIIENSLAIIVGILLFRKELYAKFVGFSRNDGSIANAEELVLAGLLCSEEKVRTDFENSMSVLATNLNSAE